MLLDIVLKLELLSGEKERSYGQSEIQVQPTATGPTLKKIL